MLGESMAKKQACALIVLVTMLAGCGESELETQLRQQVADLSTERDGIKSELDTTAKSLADTKSELETTAKGLADTESALEESTAAVAASTSKSETAEPETGRQ